LHFENFQTNSFQPIPFSSEIIENGDSNSQLIKFNQRQPMATTTTTTTQALTRLEPNLTHGNGIEYDVKSSNQVNKGST